MKTIKSYIGLILIILGALTLLLTRLHTLSSNNTILLAGLLFIVAGIIAHIVIIKRESPY